MVSYVPHDRCGNMTRVPKPDDWEAHYDLTYDAWNRLVSVTDGATQDLIAEYEYDGRNYRITKTLPSESPNSSSSSSGTTTATETRHFYYNHAWQCLEERLATDPDPSSSSGTPADPPSTADRQFTWGARYIDDLILRDRDAGEGGDLGKTGSGLDERLYAMQDPNWNVVAIAEPDGDIVERFAYDAYGKSKELDPDFTDYTGTHYKWHYRYTGRRLDVETGLDHYRRRYYHAELGRFVIRDPVRFEGKEINQYRYVSNQPMSSTDPMGLKKYTCTAINTPKFPSPTYVGRWQFTGALIPKGMCAAGSQPPGITLRVSCYWKVRECRWFKCPKECCRKKEEEQTISYNQKCIIMGRITQPGVPPDDPIDCNPNTVNVAPTWWPFPAPFPLGRPTFNTPAEEAKANEFCMKNWQNSKTFFTFPPMTCTTASIPMP